MLKLLLLKIVELSMFAVLSKREWKKPCSLRITSNQLTSEVTSYTEGECCFWGCGAHKGEGFIVSHFLSDFLFYSSDTPLPVVQKETAITVLLLIAAVIKVL